MDPCESVWVSRYLELLTAFADVHHSQVGIAAFVQREREAISARLQVAA
jgi:hypothetical protein